jgi:hypothetical protein
MARTIRRHLALTVAISAVLAAGAAVALGATGTGHKTRSHARHARLGTSSARRQGGLLGAAATYLGTERRQLREQLASGKTLAQIAAATPGKSEAGLVAAIVAAVKAKVQGATPADLETRVKALVNRSPGTELRRHARLGAARHGALRAAALSYLGLTRHQLREQLRSGKTLAEIADGTPGKSAAGLAEALTKALDARLSAATRADRLSKQADAARSKAIQARVTKLLDHPPHLGKRFSKTPAPAN